MNAKLIPAEPSPQIRVPAVFHYQVDLAPDWNVVLRNKAFIVIAPSVSPSLLVAVDLSKLEQEHQVSGRFWHLATDVRSAPEVLLIRPLQPCEAMVIRNVGRFRDMTKG